MTKYILELNEFNHKLFLIESKKRKSLSKIINKYKRYSLKIPDDYDSNYLEPWSQWVGIHSGLSSSQHKIMHLGDVSDLNSDFIWESSPEKFGAVWGCLNVRNPKKNTNINFLPDPWSLNTESSNKKYYDLEKFIKIGVNTKGNDFLSKFKNYTKLFYYFIKCLKLFIELTDKGLLKILLDKKYFLKYDPSIIYSIIEYFSFKLFLSESKENKTNIVFLNMIAHCQHYYWNTDKHYQIEFCFDILDLIISKMPKKNTEISIINGLSQSYSGDIEDWYSYFPNKGWVNLIKNIFGITYKDIQPCMSYDCIIKFNSKKEKIIAIDKLNSVLFNDNTLFIIDTYNDDDLKIFIRLNYYEKDELIFEYGEKSFVFQDLFTPLARRTGKHIQRCDIYTNSDYRFDCLTHNHELYNYYAE